jgi:hypothetical protein
MLGLIVISLLGAWTIVQRQTISEVVADLPTKLSEKLDQLWTIAQESLLDKMPLSALKSPNH